MPKAKIWKLSAQIVSVHDGDTFKARLDLLENRGIAPGQSVDLGFRIFAESAYNSDAIGTASVAGLHLYLECNVRLHSINTPELPTPEGVAAAEFLRALLPPGTTVHIISKRLDLYGRCLGDVTLPDGRDVGALLIAAGHAQPATDRKARS